ncbi:MAG: tellurite resistance/C4-dicarboxylate transporter family protein [Dehalococcoidales bacterium]
MAKKKLGNTIREGIRDLHPGYFALVMATGIVSIAAYLLELTPIAWALFWINIVAYSILWILLLARLVGYFPKVVADVSNHGRGPGFFTVVAATCVLGSQLVIMTGSTSIALVLWLLGLVLWPIIMYSFFTAMTVKAEKPPLEIGLSGAWLIAIVATQSIAVLGTMVSSRFGDGQEIVLFLALTMYLLGGMLYIIIITLIFYRFTFFKMSPQEIAPPYWINMGAVAITTLAGATLILNSSQWGFLQELLPFIKGFTLFFWAAGTWWIPLLLILGGWMHFYKRLSIRYNPLYWGMVFPLGMYTTCTFQLAKALGLDFLNVIPTYFIYLALVAWLAAFIGLVHRLITLLRPGQTVEEA